MRKLVSLTTVLAAWLVVGYGCLWNATKPSASDWQEVESPTASTLWSVFLLDEEHGWAVGDSGAIVSWDGANWSNLDSPTSANLQSVYFCSSTDGWAVGCGVMLHYDGTEWCEAYSDSSAEFYSVWFTAPAEGWVVGRRLLGPPEPYSFVLHYDGTKWSEESKWPDYDGFHSVRFAAENDGWIGGSGVILHFDGSQWTVSNRPSGAIWGLDVSSVSDVWATSVLPVPCDGDTVRSRILHYDGSSWEIAHESTTCLFSVSFPTPTQGWAGGSDILYFNGNCWDIIVSEASIRTLSFLNADEGWAVGSHGRILRYERASGR